MNDDKNRKLDNTRVAVAIARSKSAKHNQKFVLPASKRFAYYE